MKRKSLTRSAVRIACVACAAFAFGGAHAESAPPAPSTAPSPPSVPPATAPAVKHPARALLDAVAKAAGGRENVAAWKGLMFRGKVLPLVDGPSSTLRVDLDLAGSLREEMRDARGERTHWLSGPMAWSGGERPKAAPLELAADLRARFHELAATFELVLADADSLEDLGPTPEKWTRLAHRVGGIRLGYDVDVTGRLHRVVRLDGQGRDGSTQMEIEELREVRGVRLPFRWTSVVDGHALSETILERVERVDERDLSEFLPPGVAGGL